MAHDISLPTNIDQFELVSITDDVYAVHGILGLPDQQNRAFISNSGVIISDHGVIVIDSGGSLQVGKLLLQRIEAITDKPVIAVFNTHIHGDHWLGNTAIKEAHPDAVFFAHANAIEKLRNGAAEEWLDIMKRMIDDDITNGKLVLPDAPLNGGETFQVDGIELKTHHTGHAHTDNDIMLESPSHKVLFTGDIVEHRRAVSVDVPQDFSARGQIDAIRYLLDLPVDIYVPGHGETGSREIPESSLRFLEILYGSVKRYYQQDLQDFEMRDKVVADLAEFQDWSGMDQIGKLISSVYLQVEAEEFE
ncbi:MAG: MBL fold metallo-hydrolase [Gammaproteobacteria bacterium]